MLEDFQVLREIITAEGGHLGERCWSWAGRNCTCMHAPLHTCEPSMVLQRRPAPARHLMLKLVCDCHAALADEEDDDDDDETCGFCRFMKAGGCKAEFTVRSLTLITVTASACLISAQHTVLLLMGGTCLDEESVSPCIPTSWEQAWLLMD